MFFRTSRKTLEEIGYIFCKNSPFENSSGVETPSERDEKVAAQHETESSGRGDVGAH